MTPRPWSRFRFSKTRLAIASALAWAVLTALSGCKSHPGDTCSPGQATCVDKVAGLYCGADGKYAAMTCGGGCTIAGRDITCNNFFAAEKDGCAEIGDIACAYTRKSALECGANHQFAVGETCKGPRGCTVSGSFVDCDNDISDIGDPCHTIGDYACTGDKGLLLRCDEHTMTPRNACRGPKACRIFELPQEKKIDFVCDDSVAQEDDPCDTSGEEACSMDKKGMYVCKAGKFSDYRPCAGVAGCTYEERTDHYSCDDGSHAAATASAADKKAPGASPTHKKRAK